MNFNLQRNARSDQLMSVLFAVFILILNTSLADEVGNDRAEVFVVQQQAEERYRRLYSIVEDLQAANLVLQKRIQNLEKRLQQMHKTIQERQSDAITNEQLEALSAKIKGDLQAIEDRRVSDNQKILDALRQLSSPSPASSSEIETSESTSESEVKSVYEIRVETGYTLSAIAKKYRDEGHSISVKDILRVNPGLDPRRLQPGQIIYIPARQ